MNKNLHNIDDLFRSALEGHEEIPSAGVKARLGAALDKKNAQTYKRKLIVWKRAALLLLIIFIGVTLYETGIFNTGSVTRGKETTDKKSASPDAENHKSYPNNTPWDRDNENAASNKSGPENNKVANIRNIDRKHGNLIESKTQKDSGEPVEGDINNTTHVNDLLENKLGKQKKIFIKDQHKTSTSRSYIDKNQDYVLVSRNHFPTEKIISIPLHEKNSMRKIAGLSPTKIKPDRNAIMQKEKPTVNDTLLRKATSKNIKEKRKKIFNPFWMATGFASYDRAGYRLDSDQPVAINSIKHREVHEPSFSLGILTTRQFTKHWGLQSGLIYSNIQIGISPQKMFALQEPAGDIAYKYITSSGYAYIKPGFGAPPVFGDSLTAEDAKHTIENITIPLCIKFIMPRNKISLTAGAGIESNFITKANLEVDIADAFNREIVIVKKLNGTKSFYWSFVADAELRYMANKKMSVIFRPVYRVAISPITKNNVVETFPNSFGIGAGIAIKF